MTNRQTDIVLVDDHPLLAAGLKASLASRDLVLEAAPELTHENVIAFVIDHSPQLVVLDHSIPPMGISTGLIAPIRALEIPVAMLTGSIDDALWGSLLAAGALGVLGKDEPMQDLVEGLVQIIDGKPFRPARTDEYRRAWQRQSAEQDRALAPFQSLSKRESTVLRALVDGNGPNEIADAQFVSVETVRSQLKSAFRKLQVSSQLEAVALAHETGWNTLPRGTPSAGETGELR